MKILVTGGAGYVGSVVAEELLKEGYRVVVLDNLKQGHQAAVPRGAEFVQADICEPESLEHVFRRHSFDAVMHLAAETVVEYSMTDPWRYFRTNVMGGLNLLEAMRRHGVPEMIFSSSAAVYGEPQATPIEEEHPKVPVNAYGESKLMFERILEWYGRAYGIKYISLRYFNAAGASDLLGEDHRPETHLIPNVLRIALLQSLIPTPQPQESKARKFISVFGTDYPTKDGTCIRDYIHVVDIARAHILALEKLNSKPRTRNLEPGTVGSGQGGGVYNLGSGKGYSVLEVIETAKKVTGVGIPVKFRPRRPGDPAILVASLDRAKKELAWRPRFPLEAIIESAWKWMREHPEGYGGRG